CFLSCAFFFSSRRRHTRFSRDWSSDVCSSDLQADGTYTSAAGELAGVHVYKADGPVLEALQREGKLVHSEKFSHSYPHCWRTKRSEERRVGNECRARSTADYYHKNRHTATERV